MQPEHDFEAVLEAAGDTGGVYVLVPFSVQELYGTRGRVPILATFDGYPYQGSIVPMGEGLHGLLILKQIRKAIGKTVGDTVRITLSRDFTERKIEAPADLAEQLAAHPKAAAYFNKLAYTHQREYVRWLEGAKKPETRTKRLGEMVEMLAQGRKRS